MIRIGAAAKCAPPLRSERDRNELREKLLRGYVDTVGSDHSPSPPELKRRDNFFEVWGGIAGVQSTLRVLLTLGIAPDHVASLTAANPARRFRIGRKGSIAPGFDADLTLVDL